MPNIDNEMEPEAASNRILSQVLNPAIYRIISSEELSHHRSASASLPPMHSPQMHRSSSLDSQLESRRPSSARKLLRRTSSFGRAPLIIHHPSVPVSETESSLRWFILILSCLLLFGNYYAYDNPAALNIPLQEYLGHDYDAWQYELNLLYSVYSFPNMFLPFIGGALVDSWDPKRVLMAFSLAVCAGQTLFAIGTSMKSYTIMLMGRVLFGIGGESIGVVQASITSSWFKNKELAFALGMNLCIARLGSVVNAICSPRIAKAFNAPTAAWAGAVTCYLSFFCAFLLVCLMASLEKKKSESERSPSPDSVSETLTEASDTPSENTPLLGRPEPAKPVARYLMDMGYYPFTFWMVCLICILLYGTVVPFNNIASDFLMSKWYPNDTEKAGLVMSVPDTISAFMVPIFGVVVDRYGGRASALLLCSIVIATVHLILGLTMWNPIPSLVLLGISYSIYGVAIWPSIATVIQDREAQLERQGTPRKLIGSAFGISTSALNTALTIFPLIAAQIRVGGSSFLPVEMFFASLALLGGVASAILWIVDVQSGSVLQAPDHQVTDGPLIQSPELESKDLLHD